MRDFDKEWKREESILKETDEFMALREKEVEEKIASFEAREAKLSERGCAQDKEDTRLDEEDTRLHQEKMEIREEKSTWETEKLQLKNEVYNLSEDRKLEKTISEDQKQHIQGELDDLNRKLAKAKEQFEEYQTKLPKKRRTAVGE